MADFGTDERGGLDDRVRLELGGEEVLVSESYDVQGGILSQPSAFSIRLGHGGVAADLMRKFPPKTPFKLRIGDVLQYTGETDGYRAGGGSGATEVTILGRDSLAPIHDGYVENEKDFLDSTFSNLVRSALQTLSLDPTKLKTTAEADRKIRAGVNIKQLGPPRTVDEIVANVGAPATPNGAWQFNFAASIQCKLGERWYDFLRRYLDRAGLFLWAGADGSYILSQPNANLRPVYRIVRRRGQACTVEQAEHTNETTHRHSSVTIYGKGGGRKTGRTKNPGASVDDEMFNGFRQNGFAAGGPDDTGYRRPLVMRDVNCGSIAQAEFLASRKLAEERRAGWSLVYTLTGHTTPTIQGSERAVWTFDTLVEVEDDEFGISGVFYIENVHYHRDGSGTTTTIRLMRVTDLLFGGIDE
jgi:prophage tail gpP-like protein